MLSGTRRGRLHLLLTQVLLPSQDTLASTPRDALYLLPEYRVDLEGGAGLEPLLRRSVAGPWRGGPMHE